MSVSSIPYYRPHSHHLERTSRHGLERIQLVVVPASVRGTGNEPVAAVVRDDHSVRLERPENHLCARREGRDVEARLEPHAHAHWWPVGARVGAREVPGGGDVRVPRMRYREAQRMENGPTLYDFVVAHQTRKDGEPRGVSRRPTS